MSEVMADIHDGIIIQTSFYLLLFLYQVFWCHLSTFGQMKQANEAYVKLFSWSETTCNSIFRRFRLILVEIFVFITMVLTHKFLFFCITPSERYFGALVK